MLINPFELLFQNLTYEVREFDDDLVRRLLQTIRVINEDTLEIQFKSGIVMKQRLPYYD